MAYDTEKDMIEICGLLKFLAEEKSSLQISPDRLSQLIKHIAYGDAGTPNEDHERLLEKLTVDQILTVAENRNYVISDQILSSQTASLEPEIVAGLLTKVFRWDDCKDCRGSNPEKDLVLIYLRLKEKYCNDILSLTEKIESTISLSNREKHWLTEQKQVCRDWVSLASTKSGELSPGDLHGSGTETR